MVPRAGNPSRIPVAGTSRVSQCEVPALAFAPQIGDSRTNLLDEATGNSTDVASESLRTEPKNSLAPSRSAQAQPGGAVDRRTSSLFAKAAGGESDNPEPLGELRYFFGSFADSGHAAVFTYKESVAGWLTMLSLTPGRRRIKRGLSSSTPAARISGNNLFRNNQGWRDVGYSPVRGKKRLRRRHTMAEAKNTSKGPKNSRWLHAAANLVTA